MRKLAVLLAVVASALMLMSCATTDEGTYAGPTAVEPAPPQATAGPAPTGPGLADQAKQPNVCRAGFYFCPGKVAGCCPNGWGCASTHCIRPKSQGRAADRRCQPGFYFCPGEVSGCCPNGWGCASTHCVRPAKQRDL